ncbi:hypothetical protein ACFQ6C_26620 [Streptomyces sp. NPDC056454]|uniref:hypothetical protein n=1 Tax=Streptomyces sp. NPDC056454 TaxID=3345823 RepID=UPI00369BA87E
MDPMNLAQLLHELSSPHAETETIHADRLAPGHVLAGPGWDRHVVTAVPNLLNSEALSVPVRHLHGGHTLTRHYLRRQGAPYDVTVYRGTLAPRQVSSVPSVPRCFVPNDPETGDRVYYHSNEVLALGEGRYFEFDGEQWRQVHTSSDGRRARDTVRYFEGIRHLVSDPAESSPLGWYTYQPAGHTPHLYVDGLPMPARRAEGLAVGDILRLPGGGRLAVRKTRQTADGMSLNLELVAKSVHRLRHLTWANAVGDMIEHHDSGRTQALYATEPRPSELLTAAELHPEDTVITSWGARTSSVATVTDVWRQPVRAVLHLHATAADGRLMRIQSGIEPRHLLLHRVPQQPLRATA